MEEKSLHSRGAERGRKLRSGHTDPRQRCGQSGVAPMPACQDAGPTRKRRLLGPLLAAHVVPQQPWAARGRRRPSKSTHGVTAGSVQVHSGFGVGVPSAAADPEGCVQTESGSDSRGLGNSRPLQWLELLLAMINY